MRDSRLALRVIAAAVALDCLSGVAFAYADHIPVPDGLWFATVTATTVGYGDIVPRGALAHLLAVAIMASVIPLFAAAFSLFTTGLTAAHVRAAEAGLKEHLEERLRHHLGREER